MTRMLIVAASIILASNAQGNPVEIVATNAPSARVSVADLDLSSVAGRQSLAGRVKFAADALCRENNVEPLAVKLERMRCYRIAVASGAASMNHIGR